MILGSLPIFRKRDLKPANELQPNFDVDVARTLNHLLERGIARARRQVISSLVGLLGIAIAIRLGWTPTGILAFLVYSTALTVFIDVGRTALSWRRIRYSHARAIRVDDVLDRCRAAVHGMHWHRTQAWRPPPLVILGVALGMTVVVLPAVIIVLKKLDWITWNAVFGNIFLPFLILAVGFWRVVRSAFENFRARAAPLGYYDVLLESDDAVDVYLGIFLLSWSLLLFGTGAPLFIVVFIVLARLGFRAYYWWSLRQILPILSIHVQRARQELLTRESSELWKVGPGDWETEAATEKP